MILKPFFTKDSNFNGIETPSIVSYRLRHKEEMLNLSGIRIFFNNKLKFCDITPLI